MGSPSSKRSLSIAMALFAGLLAGCAGESSDPTGAGDNGAAPDELLRSARQALPAPVASLAATQQAQLIAGDAATNDYFSMALALDGDTAIIGALFDNNAAGNSAGGAYVFVRSGGVWSEQTKLVPDDAAAVDVFGSAVALSGDTALVSAPGDDLPGGLTDAGSVYVFVNSGGTWSQQAKLVRSGAAANDRLGTAVALDGDTAIVGAEVIDQPGFTNAGSAHVFVRSGGSWSEQAALAADAPAVNDYFGTSVALSGDTALVGALSDDHAGGTDAGSAFVFVRSGGAWSQQAKLVAGDAGTTDFFGNSVALSGDTALVGAVAAGPQDRGSAYVFVRSGAAWSQQAKLVAADASSNDRLGESVALSGDTALVTAPGADQPNLMTDTGSAYIFVRSGAAWSQQVKFLPDDAAAGDQMGQSAALSGDTALVGVPFDNHLAGSDAGSACVFVLALGPGDPCASAAECATGFCTDGVCCDTACGAGAAGDCQACSVALGASANGVCTPLTGASCDDADACTTADTCKSGLCSGSAVKCTPLDPCHVAGVCDKASGVCSNPAKPDGTACNDADACTKSDSCVAGTCTGASPVVCSASDPCHDAGACDPATGACSDPVKADGSACDDADACTQSDTCIGGVCSGASPVVCMAIDECHKAGFCNPVNGDCTDPAVPDGTPCSLGACEDGTCAGPGGTGGKSGSGGAGGGGSGGSGGSVMTASGGAGGSGATAGAGGSAQNDPPEGCACRLPGSQGDKENGLPVLGALAAMAMTMSRRRVRTHTPH